MSLKNLFNQTAGNEKKGNGGITDSLYNTISNIKNKTGTAGPKSNRSSASNSID